MNHADLHFVRVGIGDSLGERFNRPLHIALDDEIDRLDLAGTDLVEQVVGRDLRAIGQVRVASLAAAFLGDRVSAFQVIQHEEFVAGRRQHRSKPLTITGVEGPADSIISPRSLTSVRMRP